MKFAAAGRRERTLALDMTPMIDIVFQLLIFFLTTTQLARTAEELLELPREEGSNEEVRAASAFTVNLLADGTIQVADREVSLEELRRLATRSGGEAPVVRADRAAGVESLNALVRALRDAGGTSVRLAVDPPVDRSGPGADAP